MESEFRKLAALVMLRDPAAVPLLRGMAIRLNVLADSLLDPEPAAGFVDSGGMGDRATIRLIGPDGSVKAETTTNGVGI